ncbi:MAG: restriction endonuclease subunit S, partial [Chloroflexi bacterium]|nr:restriction endonuclease subunit S [Chloroflexota bacterium]
MKPYPAYQPSGLPWLGQIPAHWNTQRLRHTVQLLVSNVDKLSNEGEEPVRLCNYVDVYKHQFIHSDMNFMRATAQPDEIRKFRIRVDDVVITKDSEDWKDIGVPAYVTAEAPDLVCGYHLAILRPNQDLISGKYLHWLLQSPSVSIQFNVNANGVTRYGLSHSSIKDVWLLLPPL